MSRPEVSDRNLSSLLVSFGLESDERRYPLGRRDYSDAVLFTTEHDGKPDIFVKHPEGEVIAVSVEVWIRRDFTDVCISVLQKDEARAVARGTTGVILSYLSLKDNLFLLEVGSGAWQ